MARWEDDGRQMTLVEPFAYVDPRLARWPAAAGSSIDGASIPRAFWTVIGGPFAGEFRNASVVHDVACDVRDRPWRAVHRMTSWEPAEFAAIESQNVGKPLARAGATRSK